MSGWGQRQADKTIGDSVKTQRKRAAKRIATHGLLPLVVFVLLGCISSASAAADEPIYTIKAVWGDTYLPPGGEGQFLLMSQNVGRVDGSGPITITDQLPAGVSVKEVEGNLASYCSGVGTETLSCEFPAEEANARQIGTSWFLRPTPTGFLTPIFLNVEVSPTASGTGTNIATLSGGGYAGTATDTDPVTFSATPSDFGVVPGSFAADAFEGELPEASASRQAGAHPRELRVDFDLNEESGVEGLRYTLPHGRIKDAVATLPRGFIGNPEAMPQCDPGDFAVVTCPPDTQVGYVNIYLGSGKGQRGYPVGHDFLTHAPIYNLVPPHGQVA